MTILEAIILGILQGLTEFLPVSSSGHLVLLQQVFGIDEGAFTFIIVVHVGTLIPVLFVYYNRIKSLVKNPFQKLMFLLVLGTVPTVIAAILFADFLDALYSGSFLAIGFLITGAALIFTDYRKEGTKDIDVMTRKDALIVGLSQALAIIPGISRSGITIVGGVSRNLDRQSALHFSFLLSIPAIVGGTVFELRHILTGQTDIAFVLTAPVVVGFFAAMVSGYFAIKVMLKIVAASKLRYFAYYLILLAVLIVVDQIFFNIVF